MNNFRLFLLLFITVFLSVSGGLGRITYLDGAGFFIYSVVSAIIAHGLMEAITSIAKGDK